MGLAEIRAIKDNAGKPKPRKIYTIPKRSKKRIEQDRLQPAEVVVVRAKKTGWYKSDSNTDELIQWFEDRRKEMTGTCSHCLGKTEKADDDTFKCSIAHILPKSTFKSVATHPNNWLELCFYGQSCHTNLDNYMIDLIDLNCFDEVIKKFVSMYPSIAPNERRRIPAVLLQYIETEK